MAESDTVHVSDTWVKGKTGLLHFDVMTTNETTALTLAEQYLASICDSDVLVTLKECRLRHSEPLVLFSVEQEKQFREQGGFIVRLPT